MKLCKVRRGLSVVCPSRSRKTVLLLVFESWRTLKVYRWKQKLKKQWTNVKKCGEGRAMHTLIRYISWAVYIHVRYFKICFHGSFSQYQNCCYNDYSSSLKKTINQPLIGLDKVDWMTCCPMLCRATFPTSIKCNNASPSTKHGCRFHCWEWENNLMYIHTWEI